MNLHDILLAAYKQANPSSRVTRAFRYGKNTNATKGRECVLCGEQGPTWSGKYRQTVRAAKWEDEHACWSVLDEDQARVMIDAWLEAGDVSAPMMSSAACVLPVRKVG